MPYSKQTFSYTGGARTFTISLALGYIAEADIEVYVVGELDGGGEQTFRTFTFDSEFVVNVTKLSTTRVQLWFSELLNLTYSWWISKPVMMSPIVTS